jgi:hypothetical protein
VSEIEKDLAESLIELRLQQSLGKGYVPIQDLIDAQQFHLTREQFLREKASEPFQ